MQVSESRTLAFSMLLFGLGQLRKDMPFRIGQHNYKDSFSPFANKKEIPIEGIIHTKERDYRFRSELTVKKEFGGWFPEMVSINLLIENDYSFASLKYDCSFDESGFGFKFIPRRINLGD